MKIRKVPASWLDSPRQRGRKSVGPRIASKSARRDLGGANDQRLRHARRSADSGLGARVGNRSEIGRAGRHVGPLLADVAGSR